MIKKFIMIFIIITLILVTLIFVFLNRKEFGSLPEKNVIEKSSNYKDGAFQNVIPTEVSTSNKSTIAIFYDFLFKKPLNGEPKEPLPSIKTDIKNIPLDENVFIWLGHSSFFLRLNGITFLIDPIFSNYASPVFFANKVFAGTNIYSANDFPPIDYLIISHDHWDHLDFPTMNALKDHTAKIIVPLGVDAHLLRWKFDKTKIITMDWDDSLHLENELEIFCLPARHFSGRSLKRNQSLWASFLIKSNNYTVYYSGDSGYAPHFKNIGNKFGKVDLAILENGQYNENWKNIHMSPKETIQAGFDLNAKKIMPVHNSKFVLSNHSWKAPLEAVAAISLPDNVSLITPVIGEKVDLNNPNQQFEHWWEKIN